MGKREGKEIKGREEIMGRRDKQKEEEEREDRRRKRGKVSSAWGEDNK